MSEVLRRHKYTNNRILISAVRILFPEFSGIRVSLTGAHVELLRNLLDYANRPDSFVDAYHDGYYTSPDDDALNSIGAIVAELEHTLMADVQGFFDAYVCVRDKKGAKHRRWNVYKWCLAHKRHKTTNTQIPRAYAVSRRTR